ncbi:MAG: chaperone protein DnaJ, partial [Sediminibacterium sp.]|nr:chaperone protein DnaJ [Sediminibacterium sp.]
MTTRDHYQVLNISPSATPEEIKKAFRKLAQRYHPDKNAGDRLAAEKFSEIHDAYLVLSDHKKRAEYNYLFYTENPNRKAQLTVNTPEDILHLSIQLAKETAWADPYRIDRNWLYFELMNILSAEHLHLLLTAGNLQVNRKIAEQVITSAGFLPLN